MTVFEFLGIPVFEYDGCCDMSEYGEQYKVVEWKLQNMQQYNGMYAVVTTAGKLQIWTEAGKCVWKGYFTELDPYMHELSKKLR